VTALDQLEEVTADERAALIRGDWRQLESCVERKEQLATALAGIDQGDSSLSQLQRIARATRHNLALSSALSRQVSDFLLSQRQQTTYGRGGQLLGKARTVVSLRG